MEWFIMTRGEGWVIKIWGFWSGKRWTADEMIIYKRGKRLMKIKSIFYDMLMNRSKFTK